MDSAAIIKTVLITTVVLATAGAILIDDSADAYVGDGYTIYLDPGEYFDDVPVLGTDFFINTVEPVSEPDWITDSEYCEIDEYHVNNGYRVTGTAPSEPGVYTATYHVKDVWGHYESDLTATFVVGDVDYVEPEEPEVETPVITDDEDVPQQIVTAPAEDNIGDSDNHGESEGHGDGTALLAIGAVIIVIAAVLAVAASRKGGA